jgi:transcriptional regulator with XRE-family HTH domain
LKDQRKLTNQQLADLAGIPVGTINRIMEGQTDNPSFQTVCDIVMVLDGSLDELVGITGKRGQRSAPPVSVLLCAALFVLGVLIYDLTHPMVVFFRQ